MINIRLKLVHIYLALLTIAFILASDLYCADSNNQQIVDFVVSLKTKAANIVIDSDDRSDANNKLQNLISSSLAVEDIAKFVLGRYWTSVVDEQRRRFISEYGQYLNKIYAQELYKYADFRMDIIGVKQLSGGNVYLVNARLVGRDNFNVISVDFKVKAEDDDQSELYIVDILASGISLAITQRSKFGDIIDSQGMEEVFRVISENDAH